MKILYIHQHFVSADGIGVTRSHDIARYLVSMGHQVTVICGYSSTKGLPPVKSFRLWRIHWLDGIKIVICNVAYNQNMSPYMRVGSFIMFAFIASIVALLEKGANIVFATSTPLTVTIPGVISSKIKRVPYIFEARDLWPEDHVASGRMKEGSFIHRFFVKLERMAYKNAKYITVVSDGFYNRLLERGISMDNLNMIPLGADANKFANIVPDHSEFIKKKIINKKVAIYTGAHGNTNGLYQLLDAAEKLKHRNDIVIVLIGKGSEKTKLENVSKTRGLSNVIFLDPVPISKLVGILAASHMGLIIFKQITRPRWLTPNKFYDYCFSELPSIVNFDGTTAELVKSEKIGISTLPGSSADLARAIEYYSDNELVRKETGFKARELAFKYYDRKQIAKRMEALFLKALEN